MENGELKTENGKLKKYKLGELFSIKQGFAFKSEKYLRKSPYRLCTLGNIDESNCFKFNDAKANYYSDDFPKDFVLNEGDLIIPLTEQTMGLFGNSAFIPKTDDYKFVLNQRVGKILYNASLIDKYYLHYLLATNNVRKQIEATATGTTQRNTSPDKISNVEVLIPNIDIQIKIGNFLYDIESKIALNRRMNAKLEQMAKRLYDHWFVQFDFPNADGKPYKASGGKMVWNETLKREIPDGWEVKRLGDVCEIALGGTPSTANNEFWDNGTISWLNSGEVGIFPIVESEKKITEIAVEKSTTEFLKAGSVTLSITRYLRPSILAIDACINQSVVGIKENDLFKNCFLYPYLQNEIDRLMSLRTGAQQPHINKEIVEDSFINIPPKELMEKYEKKVTPIYLQIINIAKETQKLTVLRDRLLPLLMNGQVEVK